MSALDKSSSEVAAAYAARMKAANDALIAAVPQVLDAFMKTPEAQQIARTLDAMTPGWRDRT